MIDKIKDIIKPAFLEKDAKSAIILKEKFPASSKVPSDKDQCRCEKIVLDSFPPDNIILAAKFDKKTRGCRTAYKYPFLIDVPRLHEICDYIVFYMDSNNQLAVLIVNLKSNQRGNDIRQIVAGITVSKAIVEFACRLNDKYDERISIKALSVSCKTAPPSTNTQKPLDFEIIKLPRFNKQDYLEVPRFFIPCNFMLNIKKLDT